MRKSAEETPAPPWVTVALAAACAALGYRLASGILTVIDPWLSRIPFVANISGREPRGYIFDLVGTAAALAVAVVVSKALRNRSFRANAVALCLFVVLAIFPIRIDVSTELVTCPPPRCQ